MGKFLKILFFYADTESLFTKIDTCYNFPENSSTAKITKHPAFSYSLITHCSFDSNKNKHDYYRGEDCKKIVWKDLIKHVTKIINYKKIEMLQLTKEGKKSCKQKFCSIHAKKLVLMIKNVFILEITVITLGNIGILCT